MSARAHSPPTSTFSSQSDTAPINPQPVSAQTPTTASLAKASKRRLFGLGKKKDKSSDTAALDDATTDAPLSTSSPTPANMNPLTTSPSPPSRFVAASPTRLPFALASSQSTSTLASSQIFERNVQESSIPSEMSPAIPSHIQTEDHIPAVLEASSLAITDSHLNPDQVEIVTHTAHQPASEKVAEGTASALHPDAQLPVSPQDSQHESFHSVYSHQQDFDDAASNYGALDPADVRRLSFISFADVVQAEQAESKDSLHHTPMSASTFSHAHTHSPPLPRSPSPTRSPLSSQYSQEVTTPPIGSNPTSIKGFDMSPVRSPIGSPHNHQHGELTIETMRQALRKTASGDFTASKIAPYPASSVGLEDSGPERHGFK
ncbi:hypothetical protein E4T47_05562 [Aureobasidium subglaciale]|nr:hypothetical protein E4T47_05562 [Aureobasidium subglaciale]